MSEDVQIYNAPEVIVTVEDGTLFSCVPHEMGGINSPRVVCWRIVDHRGDVYCGPLYDRHASLEEIQQTIGDWWRDKGTLGRQGMTAAKLRRWIVEGC